MDDSVLIDMPARDAALMLWRANFSARTIMEITKLDEAELEHILPRRLWYDDAWIKCPKCGGAGGRATTVPHQDTLASAE